MTWRILVTPKAERDLKRLSKAAMGSGSKMN